MEKIMNHCGNCKWRRHDYYKQAYCIFYPPSMFLEGTKYVTKFPNIRDQDVCGQWEDRQPKK